MSYLKILIPFALVLLVAGIVWQQYVINDCNHVIKMQRDSILICAGGPIASNTGQTGSLTDMLPKIDEYRNLSANDAVPEIYRFWRYNGEKANMLKLERRKDGVIQLTYKNVSQKNALTGAGKDSLYFMAVRQVSPQTWQVFKQKMAAISFYDMYQSETIGCFSPRFKVESVIGQRNCVYQGTQEGDDYAFEGVYNYLKALEPHYIDY